MQKKNKKNKKMHERMGTRGPTVGRGKGEWGTLTCQDSATNQYYHARKLHLCGRITLWFNRKFGYCALAVLCVDLGKDEGGRFL